EVRRSRGVRRDGFRRVGRPARSPDRRGDARRRPGDHPAPSRKADRRGPHRRGGARLGAGRLVHGPDEVFAVLPGLQDHGRTPAGRRSQALRRGGRGLRRPQGRDEPQLRVQGPGRRHPLAPGAPQGRTRHKEAGPRLAPRGRVADPGNPRLPGLHPVQEPPRPLRTRRRGVVVGGAERLAGLSDLRELVPLRDGPRPGRYDAGGGAGEAQPSGVRRSPERRRAERSGPRRPRSRPDAGRRGVREPGLQGRKLM
ncbi:MAG: tRNA pseudouridine(38-40) synthase, partial [uncultured Rubrobacteraceae bacterium]